MVNPPCAVCGNPCRGRCPNCNARLCVDHKAKRNRCQVCPSKRTFAFAAMPAIPTYQQAVAVHVDFDALTPDEARAYFQQLKARLEAKQRREKAYLDRRAARGTHTPTDEAYRNDQILEDELINLLDELCKVT